MLFIFDLLPKNVVQNCLIRKLWSAFEKDYEII